MSLDRAPSPTALVRPYVMTGGRARPVGDDLPIEAMVVASEAALGANLQFEHGAIVSSCAGMAKSVAELSAELAVPLGVARVLVADLREVGHVRVREGIGPGADDVNVLERLITRVSSL